MIKHTEAEIIKFIDRLYPQNSPQIKVYINNIKKMDAAHARYEVNIAIINMYDYVPFGFSYMKKISEFFDSENISNADRCYEAGCETCDYGSTYEINLRIWE